jgi:hypothetical protein
MHRQPGVPCLVKTTHAAPESGSANQSRLSRLSRMAGSVALHLPPQSCMHMQVPLRACARSSTGLQGSIRTVGIVGTLGIDFSDTWRQVCLRSEAIEPPAGVCAALGNAIMSSSTAPTKIVSPTLRQGRVQRLCRLAGSSRDQVGWLTDNAHRFESFRVEDKLVGPGSLGWHLGSWRCR